MMIVRRIVPVINWQPLALILGLTLVGMSYSQPGFANTEVGKVILATGVVTALDRHGNQRALARRSVIYVGDTLRTDHDSMLQLRFTDKAMMTLRENTEFWIEEYRPSDPNTGGAAIMKLLSGGFRTITGSIGKGDKDDYRVTTQAASIGIRGTHYEAVQTDNEKLLLAVWQGGIKVENEAGAMELGSDQAFRFSAVEPKTAPKGLLTAPAELQAPITSAKTTSTQASKSTQASQDKADDKEQTEDNEQSASGEQAEANNEQTEESSDSQQANNSTDSDSSYQNQDQQNQDQQNQPSLDQTADNNTTTSEDNFSSIQTSLDDNTDQFVATNVEANATQNQTIDQAIESNQLDVSDDNASAGPDTPAVPEPPIVDSTPSTFDPRITVDEYDQLVNNSQLGIVTFKGAREEFLATVTAPALVVGRDYSADGAVSFEVNYNDNGFMGNITVTLSTNITSLADLVADINDDLNAAVAPMEARAATLQPTQLEFYTLDNSNFYLDSLLSH